MLKSRKSARRFWFIPIFVLFIANAAIAQQVQSDCSGGFNDAGPTVPGEFTELPDPMGALQVTSLPIITDNALTDLNLIIKNSSPNQARLSDGYFSLELSYTPAGGSEIVVPATAAAADVYCDLMAYGDTKTILFTLTATMPVANWASINCKLTFDGDLGSQFNTTLVKTFPPGQLLFNEEWDNGLTSNYTWTIKNDLNTDPTNGISTVSVGSGKLTMYNIRYAGKNVVRYNQLEVDLAGGATTNGILITPNSHILFLIDEMYTIITDNQSAEHMMYFDFNDGGTQYSIVYSAESIWVPNQGNITKFMTFIPGQLTYNNIYQLLQSANVSLPTGGIYLTTVGFLQHAFWNPDNNVVLDEINFNMIVDAVRVVDQNVQ